MADQIIKQIKATDGTVYELDAKYFGGRTFEEVFAQADAMIYKGIIEFTSATGTELYTKAADKGHVYKVSIKDGLKKCRVNGILVDNGDMLICNTDGTPIATSSEPQADKWDVIQSNIDASGLATATHVHSYTPEGDVSQPEFTGKQVETLSGKASITSTVTDNGHSHEIGYTTVSVSENEQSVPVASSDHAHSFTPEGSVDVTLIDNGHSHKVTAAGSVKLTQTKNVAATSVEDGGHTHTIDLADVTVSVTDSKHKHTATVTEGIAAAQVFTGSEVSTKATEDDVLSAAAQGHTHAVEATGTAAAQKFTGIEGVTEVDAENVVIVSKKEHVHTYTPKGSVSGDFSGKAGTTTSINGTTNVAADGHKHGGALKAVVSNNILTFSLDGEVNASTEKTAVATSTHTHGYTPEGTLANVKFTGEEGTVNASDATNVATVSLGSHTHKYTPQGTNASSSVSVSGNASVTEAAALSVASYGHTHKVTAAGTNASSAVSGTAVTISDAATGISAKFSIDSAATSVAGAHTHTVNITQQPEFSAAFTGSEVTTVAATTGLEASAEFTGTAKFTQAASKTVDVAALAHSHNYEKATTIVAAATGITVTSVDAGHTHKVTAEGTVSKPTFTGRLVQTGEPETGN